MTSHVLCLCVCLAVCCGCSTVATLVGGSSDNRFICDENYTIPRVYSGLFNDVRFVRGEYQEKGIVFWDIPFSLAADTVVLPYTMYSQLRRGNLCDKKEEPIHKKKSEKSGADLAPEASSH
jgi:uncharacterized protein YceK